MKNQVKKLLYWAIKNLFTILIATLVGVVSFLWWNNIYLSIFLGFVVGYLYLGYQISAHGKEKGENILFSFNAIAIIIMAISVILGFIFGQIAIGVIAIFTFIFLLLLQGLYEVGKEIDAHESYLTSRDVD